MRWFYVYPFLKVIEMVQDILKLIISTSLIIYGGTMVMMYQDKYDHFVMKWKVVSNQSGWKRTSINNV
jgi:hypothetical protein